LLAELLLLLAKPLITLYIPVYIFWQLPAVLPLA